MEIVENESTMTANWFGGDDYEINLYEGEETLVTIVAQKKHSKYEVSANIANSILLNWSLSPKLSKSDINLEFNATLTIKSDTEWNPDTVIPFKGSWKYDSIPEFTVTAPSDAQDLSELLWSYLWSTIYLDPSETKDGIEANIEDNSETEVEANNEANAESNSEEVWEIKSLENTDNTTTAE